MKTWSKLRSLFRRRKLDAEMSDEMRAHLEMLAERKRAEGMSEEDARFAARREFGGVEQIKEQVRDQCGWVWLELLVRDLGHAIKHLRKALLFSAITILLLGLGISVNTALFSVVDARLLRTLPAERPGELILLHWLALSKQDMPQAYDFNVGVDGGPADGSHTLLHFSREAYEHLAADRSVLAGLCATAHLFASTVVAGGVATYVPEGQLVSGNYYDVLGVKAERGRVLQPDDDRPGAPPVCVISRRFWESRFAGDDAAIGKTILVNRVPTQIIGVTPADFHGVTPVGRGPDITLPLSVAATVRRDSRFVSRPDAWWLRLIGRRQPGVSPEQARASLETVFRAAIEEQLGARRDREPPRLLVTSVAHNLTPATLRRNLALLVPIAGMAGLVLLAACANVATLLLARGLARRREIATRMALGASRARVVRQLLMESLVLALAGAALGVLFSRWNLELLVALFPQETSGYAGWLDAGVLTVKPALLAFSVVIGGLTGIAFGLAPALRVTRLDLMREFQSGQGSSGSGTKSRAGRLLVLVQVVTACVLLVGAGLFGRTLRNLEAIDLGFARERVLMFAADAQAAGYTREEFARVHERIAAKLRTLPGVQSVTYSGWPVLTGEGGPYSVKVSLPGMPGETTVLWNQVGPDFPETYAMPLLAGRSLDARDESPEASAVVVNESFRRKLFGQEDAVGRQISFFDKTWRIVGVVRDARLVEFELLKPVAPLVLLPFEGRVQSFARYAVRTDSAPETVIESIRRAIGSVAPNVAMAAVTTQDEQVGWRFLVQRMFARIAVFVGLLALVLSSVGLGGLMAHAVVRRTSEIGIRMALGAQPGQVLWMILRETLSIVAVGLIVGLGAAAAMARLMTAKLYGLTPLDPLTYAAAAGLLVMVSLVAAWIPARRAAKVDPMVALRAE